MPALVQKSSIPLAIVLAGPPPPPVAQPTGDFVMQSQGAHDRWCWAATAVSVTLFYEPSDDITQCQLVNDLLTKKTCCGSNGYTPACNVAGYLSDALDHTHVLERVDDGSVGIDVVEGEIDNGRVLCWRFEWSTGNAHFGAIADYVNGGADPLLRLDDPWLGQVWVRLADLVAGVYQDRFDDVRTGVWTNTYFTHAP